MRPVVENSLWIGNAGDLCDVRTLHAHGIRIVIDLAIDEPVSALSRDLVYCRIPVSDDAANPEWMLRLAIHTTVRCLAARVPTLIACSNGMSRSPAIAAAALSIAERTPPDETLTWIVHGRPCDVSPALWTHIVAVTIESTHDPA